MPLVLLDYDPNFVPSSLAGVLAKALPLMVADALYVDEEEDGRLTEDDIEVRVRPHGPLDVGTMPLQITIFANEFPARAENLADRRAEICAKVRGYLGAYSEIPFTNAPKGERGFVWVLLCPASFETF